jgi:hypothetical protein
MLRSRLLVKIHLTHTITSEVTFNGMRKVSCTLSSNTRDLQVQEHGYDDVNLLSPQMEILSSEG